MLSIHQVRHRLWQIGVAVLRTTSYRPPTRDLMERLIATRTVAR